MKKLIAVPVTALAVTVALSAFDSKSSPGNGHPNLTH